MAAWVGEVVLLWVFHGQSAWRKAALGGGAASGEAEGTVSHTELVRTRQY
jgi:hypothetical protein